MQALLNSAMCNTLLDHAAIAARIPHAGPMCLLEHVIAWDENHIECISASHRGIAAAAGARSNAAVGRGSSNAAVGGSGHPLSCNGRLPATAAIEYAAQAMALHGGLVQEIRAPAPAISVQSPRRGFLAALRSVELHCRWIDPEWPLLTIRADRFAGDEVQVLYDFQVLALGLIAQGRAVVILDAGARGGMNS